MADDKHSKQEVNLLKRKSGWDDSSSSHEELIKLGYPLQSLKHLHLPYSEFRFLQQILAQPVMSRNPGEESSSSVNEDDNETKEKKVLMGSSSSDDQKGKQKEQEWITQLGLTLQQIWSSNRSYSWKVMETHCNEGETLRNVLQRVVHRFLDPIAAQHKVFLMNAEQEVFKLATDVTMWDTINGRQILNQASYDNIFQKPERSRGASLTWIEASRASVQVNMDHIQLAFILTDVKKWHDLFPTIVSRAASIEVTSSGKSHDNPDGSLQLIYYELQVTSPLIPNLEFICHRSCRQIDPQTWVIVDTYFEPPQGTSYASRCRCFPSGCLIERIGDCLSKVTWVEHLEIEENKRISNFYSDMFRSGLAYGAERWVASLKRSCERISYANGGDHLNEGKQHVMNLAKRMVSNFFAGMNAHSGRHMWSSVFGEEMMKMYVTLRESDDPVEMIVGAATTILVPFSPEFVFGVLREETNRVKWDVLLSHKKHTKLLDFKSGDEAGNNISTFLLEDTIEPSVLKLQESTIDPFGSLLVWSVVDKDEFDLIMEGDEDIDTNLMPSGFAISLPDFCSSDRGGSSLITFVLQMLIERRELSEVQRTALMKHMIKIVKNTFVNVHMLLLQSSCLRY